MSVAIYDHDETSPLGIRHVAVATRTGRTRWEFEMCADPSIVGTARSFRSMSQQINEIDQQLLNRK